MLIADWWWYCCQTLDLNDAVKTAILHMALLERKLSFKLLVHHTLNACPLNLDLPPRPTLTKTNSCILTLDFKRKKLMPDHIREFTWLGHRVQASHSPSYTPSSPPARPQKNHHWGAAEAQRSPLQPPSWNWLPPSQPAIQRSYILAPQAASKPAI